MVMSISWLYLLVAIPFSVLGTVSMKMSDGLTRWKPTVLLCVFYLISFTLLTLAIKGIDVSVGYAIWSGIGTMFIAIISRFLFKESICVKKLFFLTLIIIGVFGVHLTDVL